MAKKITERKDLVGKHVYFEDLEGEIQVHKPFAAFEVDVFNNPNEPRLHGKKVISIRYPGGGADIPVENIQSVED